MSSVETRKLAPCDRRVDCLNAVASACESASSDDRALDALIALAVFPGLAGLARVEAGVWLHADGARIRALRYTSDRTAAATLVPGGHWIEIDPANFHRAWIHGPLSGSSCSALNPLPALALTAAALRAQAHHLSRSSVAG